MANQHDGQGHGHHIIPLKVYWAVFGALVFLTLTTTEVASLDLGGLNVPVALLIAGMKASLVVLFFMALRYDNKVNAMIFSVGLLFVLVFIGFVLLDTEFRGEFDDLLKGTVMDQQATQKDLEARQKIVDTELAPPDSAR
jgi:cytochrome c oxidase subunit 4